MSKGANIHDKDQHGRSSIRLIESRFGLSYLVKIEYADILVQLLAHGAEIPLIRSHYRLDIKNILKKWPVFMGILALQGLSLYYILDASTIIDLYQYLGEKEESN